MSGHGLASRTRNPCFLTLKLLLFQLHFTDAIKILQKCIKIIKREKGKPQETHAACDICTPQDALKCEDSVCLYYSILCLKTSELSPKLLINVWDLILGNSSKEMSVDLIQYCKHTCVDGSVAFQKKTSPLREPALTIRMLGKDWKSLHGNSQPRRWETWHLSDLGSYVLGQCSDARKIQSTFPKQSSQKVSLQRVLKELSLKGLSFEHHQLSHL